MMRLMYTQALPFKKINPKIKRQKTGKVMSKPCFQTEKEDFLSVVQWWTMVFFGNLIFGIDGLQNNRKFP